MRRAEWLNGEDSNNNMPKSDEVPATPWLFCGGIENRSILKSDNSQYNCQRDVQYQVIASDYHGLHFGVAWAHRGKQ